MKTISTRIALIASIGLLAVEASAYTAGASGVTGFTTISDAFATWLNGEPGKVAAVLMLLSAVFLGVVKQNWLAAGGCFAGCLLLANANDIIEGLLGYALVI
ncbi:hypothetical protein IC617_08200 [Neiella sp. HB171785]|uniref:TrbC/VirB2 family protein n=1 Tax=Neiella litorisoli TaxID=2771431 RepID=A0A8J6QH18_9GAMM|nr:hypothetical protein [Neiella litorisoli]MBD1389405.1 hypothetical protein [Neiella litorisoli]